MAAHHSPNPGSAVLGNGATSSTSSAITISTLSSTTVSSTSIATSSTASIDTTASSSTLSSTTVSTTSSATQNAAPSATTVIVATPISSTASSIAVNTSSPKSAGPKKDAGAIAGAAVGAFFGGAALAAVLVYIMSSKRHKNRSSHRKAYRSEARKNYPDGEAPYGTEKSTSRAATAEIESCDGAPSSWESHLPQPADDNTICVLTKTSYDQIELHVENFYSSKRVHEVPPGLEASLPSSATQHLPRDLSTSLTLFRSPLPLIKQCLASTVIAAISDYGETPYCFLPKDLVQLPSIVKASSSTQSSPGVFQQASSRWRVSSAFLRPDPNTDPVYIQERDAMIQRVSETLCTASAPFGNSRHSINEREGNLVEIMRDGSQLGMTLFSQPCRFIFEWKGSKDVSVSDRDTVLVMLPALSKVEDEYARALHKPQAMVRAVTIGTR